MKNLCCLFFMFLCYYTTAQTVEVIYDEVRSTSFEGKSYLVLKSFTLKPPVGGQFKVSAATNGEFFIRMHDLSQVVPTPDKNFVREENILQKAVVDETQINTLPIDQLAVNFKYIDGMGREIETVNVKGSPGGRDVITANYFDNMGYKTKQYLSYTLDNNNGMFRSAYDAETKSFYTSPVAIASEPLRPFSETIYENSSLGRETDIYGPGNDWFTSSRRKQIKTWVDASNTRKKWTYVDDASAPTIGTYDSLVVNETMDEENHVIREFTNKRGQTVLKQQQASGNYITDPANVTWNETHYCFDDLGRLRFIIPPEATSRLATEYITDETTKQSFLNRWCFKFKYDELYNLTARWLPGWTDWEYIVYDQWSRPVLRQSPAQRERNEWSFTKYDRMNREIMTGLWISSTAVETIRANAMAATVRYETVTNSSEGYTLTTTYPTTISAANLLTINYYDNYTFLTYNNWDADLPITTYNPEYLVGFHQSSEFLTNINGQVAGKKVRVLGQSRWLNTVIRYDYKYRPVQTCSENYIGGYDRTTVKYNFIGKTEKSFIKHTSALDAVDVLREFVYNKTGLLIKCYQTTGTGPRILLAQNVYNEAGKLIEKNVHSTDEGTTFLQSIDYRHNIRGLVTSINNSMLSNDGTLNNDATDIFGMEILYNPTTQVTIGSAPNTFMPSKLYNGNISAIKWKINTQQGAPEGRVYGFQYDALDRITNAYYAADNSGLWTRDVGLYNEAVKSYDKNGNIQGIQRFGKINNVKSLMDSMYYSYNYQGTTIPNYKGISNRLWKVKDSGSLLGFKDGPVQSNQEFLYDPSGNLIFDQNKQISTVSYNHLNLPQLVEFTRPSGGIDRIRYTYDGSGTKLRTQVWKEGTVTNDGTLVFQTDYIGEIQYDKDQNTASQLSFMSNPEGRILKNGAAYEYEYFYRDHQKNVRATYGLRKETFSYRATMEKPIDRPLETPPGSTLGEKEEQAFLNIASTRFDNGVYNYTKPCLDVVNPSRSAQTNGFLNKAVGPAKMLVLSTGDKVHMEVFAKYTEVTGSTSIVTSSALIAAITGTFGVTSGEAAYSGFQANVPAIPGSGSASVTLPKAYLAYIFFNSNNTVTASGGVAITTSAYNAFEKLEKNFTATTNGKLYVYVVNETSVGNTISVYFDEMLIVHQKNNAVLQVTQASDYYPFGLSFNTFQSERIKDDFSKMQKNRYGFQGQELQKDLDLGWSAFKSRMHDASLGRFAGVDPLSDKYVYNSPYAFQENKIGRGVELEGNELVPWDWMVDISSLLYEMSPLATAEKTAYAVRDYAANEIQYATTRGHQYQQVVANPTSQNTVHKIDMTYQMNKKQATANLMIVGMEWYSLSAGASTSILEGGLLKGFSNAGRPMLYRSAASKDISLGLKNLQKGSNQLDLFSQQFDNASWVRDWHINGLSESYDKIGFGTAFEQSTTNVIRSGGKIRFDITTFDFKKAMLGKGKALDDLSIQYTDWEFNQVISKKELLDATIFYREGKPVPTEEVMSEVTKANAAIAADAANVATP